MIKRFWIGLGSGGLDLGMVLLYPLRHGTGLYLWLWPRLFQKSFTALPKPTTV